MEHRVGTLELQADNRPAGTSALMSTTSNGGTMVTAEEGKNKRMSLRLAALGQQVESRMQEVKGLKRKIEEHELARVTRSRGVYQAPPSTGGTLVVEQDYAD